MDLFRFKPFMPVSTSTAENDPSATGVRSTSGRLYLESKSEEGLARLPFPSALRHSSAANDKCERGFNPSKLDALIPPEGSARSGVRIHHILMTLQR